MDNIEIMKNRKGFIAALDQSGGSSGKTLSLYGIDNSKYNNDEEMFDLIHDMRTRIIKSNRFSDDMIVGVILFKGTMNRMINDKYTPVYLLEDKNMLSFLKIDKGLKDKENGVQLMKDIPNLEEMLVDAKNKKVFGTKMRSVIYENNIEGIKNVVKQQFDIAKIISSYGLVPIIEPEVNIDSMDKEECEKTLKEEIIKQLDLLDDNMKVMFKFTLPTIDDFYFDLTNNRKVVKVVALSGGYDINKACQLLKNNNNVIASFSRALLEGLNVNQTDEEFDQVLNNSINKIYDASVNKN